MSIMQSVTNASVVVSESKMKDCPNRDGRCPCRFAEGLGFVPPIKIAYQKVRNSEIDKVYPLNKAETLSLEVCASCAKEFEFNRTWDFALSTTAMINIMSGWALDNAKALKEERAKRQVSFRTEVQRQRQEAASTPRPHSHVAATIATLAHPVEQKPRAAYRKRTRPELKQVRSPNAPKNYGDAPKPRGEESAKNKKGKNNEKQKGKNKKR